MKLFIVIWPLLLALTAFSQDYQSYIDDGNSPDALKAIVEYTKMISANPKKVEGYYLRAHARRLFLGLYEDAIRDLNTAIDLNPVLSNLYIERAEAYMDLASQKRRAECNLFDENCKVGTFELEKAIEDINMAIKISKDKCQIMRMRLILSDIESRKQRRETSQIICYEILRDSVLTRCQNKLFLIYEANRQLGEIYQSTNNYESAIICFKRCAELIKGEYPKVLWAYDRWINAIQQGNKSNYSIDQIKQAACQYAIESAKKDPTFNFDTTKFCAP